MALQQPLDELRDQTVELVCLCVEGTVLKLLATTLALNAYTLAQELKYKVCLLEYVYARLEHTLENNKIISSNVSLDGEITTFQGATPRAKFGPPS